MSSYEIDGVRLPDPVAGRPALDFCNTRAGWGSRMPKEYLIDPAVLPLWCREAGLITPGDAARLLDHPLPRDTQSVHLRTLAFREALYPVLLGHGQDADWAVVGEEAARARGAGRLIRGNANEPASWEPVWSGQETALLAVAAAAADFLTGPAHHTVAACPGIGCGWLFSDPRGRRRWCSMAVCGNRAKARRHRHGPATGTDG